MFEIDLKRSERGASSPSVTVARLDELTRPFLPIAGLVVALLAAFALVDRSLDRAIASRKNEVAEIEGKLNANRAELVEASGRNRVVYDVQRAEIYWSDELRLLSEKVPDKLWITQVNVMTPTPAKTTDHESPPDRAPQMLAVEGGVLSNANHGNLDVIGKFIRDLQADPRFQQDFSAITLDAVNRAADPFALSFRLSLTFKS